MLAHNLAERVQDRGAGGERVRWAFAFAVVDPGAACGPAGSSRGAPPILDAHDARLVLPHRRRVESTRARLRLPGDHLQLVSRAAAQLHAVRLPVLPPEHSDQAALALGHRACRNTPTRAPVATRATRPRHCRRSRSLPGSSAIPHQTSRSTPVPSYVDTSISSLSPQTETLPMPIGSRHEARWT